MSKRIKIATFNLENLVLPEQIYYGKHRYTVQEYERKLSWVSGQFINLNADIIGFQEVFHRKALTATLLRVESNFSEDRLITEDLNGERPGVGLYSRFDIEEYRYIIDFPDEARIHMNGSLIPLEQFRHPVLRCVIRLSDQTRVACYVVHLKSKRPLTEENEHLKHNEVLFAVSKSRSLILRAAESAALRYHIVDDLHHNIPVIVMGDLNDSVDSVTTRILMGEPPLGKFEFKEKLKIFQTLLHSTYDFQSQRSDRDVYYTHIHNHKHESLDHILVSDHFHYLNPKRLGEVEYMHLLNDHVIDETLSRDSNDHLKSDHGQVVVTIRLNQS